RVTIPSQGVDVSYNYGTFDLEDEAFVPKFMYGSLDYRLSRHDFALAARAYRELERRPMIEQVLNLSATQKAALVQFLETNYLPENRFYRYDFLYDNCSTRIRDAFEIALGEAVRFADRPDPGVTFRRLLDPYQRAWPFLDAGIDWLLGAPVDRIARPYETMFLPDYLMEAFDHATIEIEGREMPLVASTDTVFWVEGYARPADPFPWAALAGWLLFGVGIAITVRAAKQGRSVVRVLAPVLFIVVGIAGLLLALLWFISLLGVTANNWHLLWSWPPHLIAGALLFPARPPSRFLRGYLFAAALLALVAALGSPFWPMHFHPALIPIMLTVAVRGGWIFYAQALSSRS